MAANEIDPVLINWQDHKVFGNQEQLQLGFLGQIRQVRNATGSPLAAIYFEYKLYYGYQSRRESTKPSPGDYPQRPRLSGTFVEGHHDRMWSVSEWLFRPALPGRMNS